MSFFTGRAHDWHGPRRPALPLELHPGDDPRRPVRRAHLPLDGGVRGPLHPHGHHGQREVPVYRARATSEEPVWVGLHVDSEE